MDRVKDKVAIVTGGASGMGEAISRLLAKEGAITVITDVNEELGLEVTASIEQDGGRAVFVKMNVTSYEEWQAAAQSVDAQFGRINILVNNAGVANANPSLEDLDIDRDWSRILTINLSGTFFGMKSVVPYMKKNKQGSIINIASVSGLVAQSGTNGYTASKGGVISLTRSLAVDFADYNIRCNAVCPTSTETPAVKKIMQETAGLREKLLADCVLPRLGKPEDIAYAVLYLASDEASYTTGAIFPIDGGHTAR
jgi:NAD(P)-dependent dehydrogenase (short-subunit alcohol dehydrogenase family)